MSFKQDYITGLYYKHMGARRMILANLETCYDTPHSIEDSSIEDCLNELGRIDTLLTTLQREYPDIIKISQAPKPAEG